MADEFGENLEIQPRGGKQPPRKTAKSITFDQAVDMGEYKPEYLATFPKWHNLTKNLKWHYIRQAIKNRRRFLEVNYAETFNVIDFSKKPQLQRVLDSIQNQLKQLQQDEEELRLQYC